MTTGIRSISTAAAPSFADEKLELIDDELELLLELIDEDASEDISLLLIEKLLELSEDDIMDEEDEDELLPSAGASEPL